MARNRYSDEQKAAVVARASEIGITAAAREAGVDRGTVSRWCKAATQDQDEAQTDAKADAQDEKQAAAAAEEPAEKTEEEQVEVVIENVEEATTEEDNVAKTIQEKVGDAVAVAQIEIIKAAGKAKRAVRDTTKKVRATAEKSVKKVRTAKIDIIFETSDGRQITPDAIAEKIPKGAAAAYVKIEENMIYWVKGEEKGSVEIW